MAAVRAHLRESSRVFDALHHGLTAADQEYGA
jgi:hypothetical protein